jgi:hypothetical protein
MRRPSILVAALLIAATPVQLAAAVEAPAGIVMAVTGPTTPRLAVHAEIAADTGVKLGAGATLTFLHYERCKLVTVAGGTVMLTRTDFATDGRTVSETATTCPKVQSLGQTRGGAAAPSGPAGVPRLASRPEIIFTGRRAAAVTEATIAEDGRIQPAGLRLNVSKGTATLPAGTSLQANIRYVLRVMFGDRTPPAELVFTAAPEAGTVVLRTE